MEETKTSGMQCPPPYIVSGLTSQQATKPKSSKALFGYAVAVTSALIVVLVLGGVYYYKSIETLQNTILKFQLANDRSDGGSIKEVEIDQSKNMAVYQLTGPGIEFGSFSVLDYTRSMLGVYDPAAHKCYLIGGISEKFPDLQSLRQHYEQNATAAASERKTYLYVVADDYPVSDKTILPPPLRSACASLPVYWLEPAPSSDSGRTKRGMRSMALAACHRASLAMMSMS